MPWIRCSEAKPWSKVLAGSVLSCLLAGGAPAAARESPTGDLTLPGSRDVILQIDEGDRWARLAIHKAIGGAFRRLGSPSCGQVFSDFTDARGRTLQHNLESTGRTAQDYLGVLRYAAGTDYGPCRRAGILAFTSPGLRTVYVCHAFREKFLTLRLIDRQELELAVLHEVLHTLGLRENPPTSAQITDQVRARCEDP